MSQVFTGSRTHSEQQSDRFTEFVSRYCLKWRLDDDGAPYIPGRLGQIYEYGEGRFAVMVIPNRPRKNYWGATRNRLCGLGLVVVQDGDCEGTAVFDPSNPEQTKAAIRAAGVSRKRQLSESQKLRQTTWLRSIAGGVL